MSFAIKNGQTSVVLRLKILDSSSSTGAGLTGVASTASGMIISTIADVESTATVYGATASVETITTLGSYSAPTATRCRWREVDSTNHKGVYELQLADARYAVTNAKSVLISVAGASNMTQADFLVPLRSDDPYVAKPANFSVFSIDGSGRVDIFAIKGSAVDTTAAQLGVRLVNIGASAVDTTAAQLGVRLVNIGASAVDTTGAQLGVRLNNINGSAVDTTGSQLGVRLNNIAGAAVDTTSAQLGVRIVNIGTAAVDTTSAQLGVRIVDAGGVTWANAINSVADGLLNRNMASTVDSGTATFRTPLQALRFLRNKWSITAGVLQITKEDDTTATWSAAVTTDSTALPIITNDPA